MSTAESEPEPESVINWDNVTAIFKTMTDAVDEVRPRPRAQQQRTLPNDDDIADLESRLSDLSFAEDDDGKVAGLKSITLWLAQWKF